MLKSLNKERILLSKEAKKQFFGTQSHFPRALKAHEIFTARVRASAKAAGNRRQLEQGEAAKLGCDDLS